MDAPAAKRPDFWLMDGDTFWNDVPPAIACFVLRGPAQLLDKEMNSGTNRVQWLVRVDPPVTDHGVTTEHVVVFADEITVQVGDDWVRSGEGALPLYPWVRIAKKRFGRLDFVTSHKVTVTTRPDWPYGYPPRPDS
jgi:hypothetical protein